MSDFYADQLIAIEDVTDEISAALDAAETDAERQQALADVTDAIETRRKAEAGGGDDIVVQVVPLYSGGRYSAYTFRRYGDLRLVFAPELALGNFGGEWDNFSYPRYKLDATFFRAYGPDGEPLDTSEHYFPWSTEGSEPGELVFVVGNPGSTNRLETVAQLAYRRDVADRSALGLFQRRLAALRAEFEEDPSPELKALILSISNAEKLYRGRVAGLNDPIILARRADTERRFREAVAADPALRAEYGDLLDRLAEVQEQKRAYAAEFGAFAGLQPQSGLASATLRRALLAHQYLQQQAAGASQENLAPLRQQLLQIADLPPSRERRFLTIRLEEFAEHLGDDADLQAVLAGRSPEAVAADLLERSVLADSARAAAALEAGTLAMDDPAVALFDAVAERRAAFLSAFAGLSAQEQELARQRGRAQYAVYGITIPPDATFSLRFADGVVAGYPYNGTVASPFVTYFGLYDHYHSYAETEIAESWGLPERWLDPPADFDYATPLNLVSTNDIVGGNSGSPLLNRDLEVVGLVFDGNIESLPTAFIFQTDRSRTISVDARGILEAFDTIYDLDRLVLELTEGELAETEDAADAARN